MKRVNIIIWRLAGYLLGVIFFFFYIFIRVKKENHREAEIMMEEGRAVFCFWHRFLLPLLWLYRGRGIWVITSMSRDGEIADALLRLYGYRTIRGSSTRGGLSAILKMTRLLKEGKTFGIAVDGPRGPAFVPKEGAFFSASKAGAFIIPVWVRVERGIELGSWDRLVVPIPFSRVVVRFGRAFVPRDVEEGKSLFIKEMKALEGSS